VDDRQERVGGQELAGEVLGGGEEDLVVLRPVDLIMCRRLGVAGRLVAPVLPAEELADDLPLELAGDHKLGGVRVVGVRGPRLVGEQAEQPDEPVRHEIRRLLPLLHRGAGNPIIAVQDTVEQPDAVVALVAGLLGVGEMRDEAEDGHGGGSAHRPH